MNAEMLLEAFSPLVKKVDIPLLLELVQNTPEMYYQKWYLQVLSFDFKSLSAIIKALKLILEQEAEKKAKLGKIKGYKGSREQEIAILKNFFYMQFIKELKVLKD